MAIKFLNSVNADSGVLYVDADNNRVGIGTTSPSSVLDVRGEVSITGGHLYFDPNGYSLIYDHDGTRDLIQVRRSGVNKFYLRGVVDDLQWEDGNQDPILKLNQNRTLEIPGYGSGTNTGTATYALSVDANGNIIEGTVQSNPAGVDGTGTVDYLTKWLDGDTLTDSNVYEASGDLVTTLNLKSSSSYPQLKLTDTDNSSTSSIRSAGGSLQHVLHDNTKSHVFYAGTTATELLRVTGDGKVGIGESNPTTKLHVYDATATAGISIQGSNAHSSDLNLGDTDDINIGRIKYDHTNDSMQFHTNNAERMRISSAGNLQLTAYTEGLLTSDASGNITLDTNTYLTEEVDTLATVTGRGATTSVASTFSNTLTVSGGGNTLLLKKGTGNPALAFAGTSDEASALIEGIAGGGIKFYVSDGGTLSVPAWSAKMTIINDGKIGIGTTSPTQDLHVVGNFRLTGEFIDSNNSGGLSGQILSSTGTGTDWVSLSEIQGVDGTGTANYLAKWSDIDTITDSVVYDDGANVGIGTSSPATKLHITGDITGTNKVLIENTNNGTNSYAGLGFQSDFGHTYHPGILLNSSTNTAYGGVDSLNIWQYHSKPITLVTNNVVRAIVTGDGNVGIGTTSPDTKLHVNVASTANYVINANDRLKVKGDGTLWWGSAADYGKLTWDTGKAIVRGESGKALSLGVDGGQDDMYINTSGNVGINTTSPADKLHVVGNVRWGTDAFQGKLGYGTGTVGISTSGTSTGTVLQIDAEDRGIHITPSNNLKFIGYTTGVLVTDANGNVSASTDYHTQDTADARYVNVTGDTMTGALNISSSTAWGTAVTEALTIKNTGSGGDINAEHSLGRIRWQTNGTNAAAIDAIRDTPGAGNNIDIAFFTNTGISSTTMAERMRINYDGRVGIGLDNPDSRLTIKAAAGEEGIKIRNVNNQDTFHLGHLTSEDPYFQMKNNVGTTEVLLRCDGGSSYINTGNVGFGTTSPDNTVKVVGNMGIYQVSADPFLALSAGNTEAAPTRKYVIRIDNSDSDKFQIRDTTEGATRLTIDTSGNVGIGTTIPNVLLDVNKSTIGEYAYFGSGSTRQLRLSSYNTVSDHAGHKINASSGNGEITLATNSIAALTVKNNQTVQLNAYGAGYVKSDASGNLTVDNSTFLQEEVDTLASVTSRGNTTSQTTFFNGTVNIGASVGMTFSSSSEGATYTPTESTVGTSRYFLRFDTTNDASFPYLTNRTPSGAVVIKTGTAAGGAENEHFRIKGGDGVVDAYFTDVNLGVGTDSPNNRLQVRGRIGIERSNGAATSTIDMEGNFIFNAGNGYNYKFRHNGTDLVQFNQNGNVGIGTTSPDYKLHVVGSSATVAKLYSTGFTNLDIVSTRTSGNLGGIRYQQSADTYISVELNGVVDGGLEIKTGDGSAAPSLNMKIDASGNLRLPAYGAGYLKTDASGNVTLDTVTSVVDGTGTASYIPKWSDSDTLTDSIIYDDGTSIGIGTTVPQGVLSVNKEDAMSSVVVSRGGTNLSASTAIGSLSFKADYADSPTDYANIYAYANAISGVRSSMDFNVKSTSGNILTAMTAYGSNTGTRIGIGTNAPAHKLTIDTGTNDIYFDEDTNINQGTGSSDQPAIYADSVLRIRQRIELWDDNDGNNYLDIRDGSTQAIKLTPDGDSWITHDLGLGTTSPDGPLHILKTASESVIIENSNESGNSDDLVIKTTFDRDVGIKLETGGGYYHIALDSNGDDSLVFHLADINAPNFEFYQNGDLQLHQYGAGTLKTDADGLVYADSSTTYVTSANGEGIYSFNDTVDASTSEDIFSISNQHGAQSFRVTFVCSTSNYSVAKTFEVVHAYGKTPVFFKVVDTGAWTYSSADHDFDVSFTNDATDDTKIVCSITNNSTTINADIVTTVFLGGSPTAITVTAL